MTCHTSITSMSNTLKKLLLKSSSHSYYIQTKYNDKQEITNTIFSRYVKTLLNFINHPSLLQERKLNIDAAA